MMDTYDLLNPVDAYTSMVYGVEVGGKGWPRKLMQYYTYIKGEEPQNKKKGTVEDTDPGTPATSTGSQPAPPTPARTFSVEVRKQQTFFGAN